MPPEELFADRNDLIDIFTDYTTSDIDDADDAARAAEAVRRAPQRADQARSTSRPNSGPAYVDRDAGRDPGRGAAVPRHRSERRPARLARRRPTSEPSRRRGRSRKKKRRRRAEAQEAKPKSRPGGDGAGPTTRSRARLRQAKSSRSQGRRPRSTSRSTTRPGSAPGIDYDRQRQPRVYTIDGPRRDDYHGYKMVADVYRRSSRRPARRVLRHSGDRAGRTRRSSTTRARRRTIDGREYMLFYDGDRLRLVGWHRRDKASYWVSNTLLQTLDRRARCSAIARSHAPSSKQKLASPARME